MNEIKELLLKMVTSGSGISSKRIVGAICYIILTVSVVVLSFINPEFNGLENIYITMIITTASLLGMTTLENLNKIRKSPEDKDNKQ